MAAFGEGVGVLGQALALLGSLLSFLGITGIVLFVLSLLLLALVGAFSPLPKMANYIAVVGSITALVLFGFEGFGELPDRAGALRGYLVFMLTPVAVVFLGRGAWRAVTRGRSEVEQLKEAITELTEQVAALRRDRRGESDQQERMLEVTVQQPRQLKRPTS